MTTKKTSTRKPTDKRVYIVQNSNTYALFPHDMYLDLQRDGTLIGQHFSDKGVVTFSSLDELNEHMSEKKLESMGTVVL